MNLTLEHVAQINHFDLTDQDDLLAATDVLAKAKQAFDYNLMDTFNAIVNRGPLYDGDVPSKSERNTLLELGLIDKVIVKGEDGFQACNYLGFAVWKVLESK